MKTLNLFLLFFLLAGNLHGQLLETVRRGSPVGQLERLIKGGGDVHETSSGGWTPLLLAAAGNRDPALVKLLLGAGALPNPRSDGYSALHLAARSNPNPDVLSILLEAEIDTDEQLNKKTEDGFTPLMLAAMENRNAPVVLRLLQAGASTISEHNGWTPLLLAAAGNSNPLILELLLDHTLEQVSSSGWGPLSAAAAYSGHINVLETILNWGDSGNGTGRAMGEWNPQWELEKRCPAGFTPLMLAAMKNPLPVISETLIAAGADLFSEAHGWTAYELAAANSSSSELVYALWQAGDGKYSRKQLFSAWEAARSNQHLKHTFSEPKWLEGPWLVGGADKEKGAMLLFDAGSPRGETNSIVVLRDGRIIAGGEDKIIRIFDPDTGTVLRRMQGRIGPRSDSYGQVWNLELDPHEQYLLVTGQYGKPFSAEAYDFRLFDLDTGRQLWSFAGFGSGELTSAAFSPDSRLLALGYNDGMVRVYEMSALLKHPPEVRILYTDSFRLAFGEKEHEQAYVEPLIVRKSGKEPVKAFHWIDDNRFLLRLDDGQMQSMVVATETGPGKVIDGLPNGIIDSHQRGRNWYLLCREGHTPDLDGTDGFDKPETYQLYHFSGLLPGEKEEAVFELSGLGPYTPSRFVRSRQWPRISVSPEGHTVSLLARNAYGLVSRPAAICMVNRSVHYYSQADVNVSAEGWLNEKEILWARSNSHQLMKTFLPDAGPEKSGSRPLASAASDGSNEKREKKVSAFMDETPSVPFYGVGLDRQILQLKGPHPDFSFSFDLTRMTAETEQDIAPWYFEPANSLPGHLPDGRWILYGYDQSDEWVDVNSPDGSSYRVDFSAWYYSHITALGFLPSEKSGLDETLLVTGDTAGQVLITILDDDKAMERMFVIHSHGGKVSWLAADDGLLASSGLDHIAGLTNLERLYPPWQTPRGSAVPARPVAKKLPYHAVGGVSSSASPFTLGDLEPTVYLYADGQDDYLMWTPDGYFMGTRGCFDRVGWYQNPPEGRNGRFIPFEQLQLHFNRPDVVLARLGIHEAELVTYLSRIHQERLKRLGLEELFSINPGDTPEIELHSPNDGRSVTDTTTSLKIARQNSPVAVAWVQLYLNGVPLFGESGSPWPEDNDFFQLEVDLLDGRNVIDVSGFSARGVESFRQRTIVNRLPAGPEPDRKPELYLVTVGVSEYQDEQFNLKYAHKDGIDMIDFFTRSPGGYTRVRPLMIHNREAVRENIMEVRNFFSTAGRNDTVILYMAGHGLRDQGGNYYFGTSDIDFGAPEKRGLPFDVIDSLFLDTPAVNRFIFMDTCFSGEESLTEYLDPEVSVRSFPNSRGLVRVSEEAEGSEEPKADLKLQDYSFIRNNLYANISYGSGATLFASSAGHEVSFEDERYRNGLYTYAVLSSLANPGTDTNGDGVISTAELQRALARLLKELSGGLQSPNVTPGRTGYDPAVYLQTPGPVQN